MSMQDSIGLTTRNRVVHGPAERHVGTRRLPLVIEGGAVGGIGASGGSPEQDQVVAETGVAALGTS